MTKNGGLRGTLSKLIAYLTRPLKELLRFAKFLILLPYALIRIKILNRGTLSPEESVDFASHGIRRLIRPTQIREEILELLRILDRRKPESVLEIGTACGGTLFLFTRIARENATIISIDLPGGKFGGGYPVWKVPLYRSFAKGKQKVYLLRADSHRQETLEKVKKILGDRKLDFLFIDGDHTYEGVKLDFEMYGKLVKSGGIVAFHDIVHHPFVPECQVERFWKEVKRRYRDRTKEIISSPDQTWAGIGVLYV